MIWACFFHIYQPADQQKDILEAVVHQSYRPLLEGLKRVKRAKITLNISGALTELLDNCGYRDVLDDLKVLVEEGRVELTSTAKYHAFLPLLPEEEVVRQIKINDETNRFYLGSCYKPVGFFPPEMGYSSKVADIVKNLGFEWVILDEIAFSQGASAPDKTKIYKIKDSNLNVFFRERRMSNLIMSSVVRSEASLVKALGGDVASKGYFVTGMDGETFGHHRPGLEKALLEIFESNYFDFVTISEIGTRFFDEVEISPASSTWASSKYDIERGAQFLSWNDPTNEIHKAQWQLLNLALGKIGGGTEETRKLMDIALASDHFFWASAKPWWSVEMIEGGAFKLIRILRSVPNIEDEILKQASSLYERIVSLAFDWQRTGKIRAMSQESHSITRIPFKERTWEAGGSERGVYEAFIKMMKDLEKESASKGEYEQAILWRDAIYKLEEKKDIYDTINVIDLVRSKIPFEDVEAVISKYKSMYDNVRGGQPEQRGN